MNISDDVSLYQLPNPSPACVPCFGVVQTLCLGQYREAFVDAAIDGSFLYDLNEDDLKNSLGTGLSQTLHMM